MNKRKWLAAVSLVSVFALAASACGGSSDEGSSGASVEDALGVVTIASGEAIKLATIEAISGDVASLGTDQVRAVELAIDDRGGELLGHPIELVTEDDGCAAETGTTAAQAVVADPQILGIIGTSCSGAAVPASEIMSAAGLVMISGSNTSPVLTSYLDGNPGPSYQPGYFRVAHNDGIQGRAAATYVFETLGLTKAATIHDGDPYTEGLAVAFATAFEELGGTITLATSVNKGDTDMRPVLTEVAASGPELVFFPIFQPEGDFVAQQAKEVEGLGDAILMGADGLLSDTFVNQDYTQGMYFSGPATPTGAAYDEFVAKYEAKYGEAPIQAFHAHAYDATNILLDAIAAVAVDDGSGNLTIGRQALRDYIASTSGFAGLTGTLTCDPFGDCADPKIDIMLNGPEQAGDIAAVRANVLFTYVPTA